MVKFGIGQAVPRTEDARLLRGEGRYTDDLRLPGMAHAAIVRSPHAHAVIRGIDTADSRAVPGVLAVYTAADLAAAGIGPIPCQVRLKNRDGTAMADKPRPVLAGDRVRHVGEPVAVVVAETARAEAYEELLVHAREQGANAILAMRYDANEIMPPKSTWFEPKLADGLVSHVFDN